MKMKIWAVVAAGFFTMMPALKAAILTGTPEALLTSGGLDRFSAGLFYQQLRRPIETETGFEMELQARTYEAVLGLDIMPWLTLYGSAGGSDARFRNISDYGQDRFSWAAGFNMNIWQWTGYGDMPVWRLNFKTRADVARYETETGNLEIKWTDYSVAFPVGYEVVFARSPESITELDHLEIFLGPALSYIDGRYQQGGQSYDFEEQNSFGVMGGVSLFITKTLFVGASASYFDRFLIRGGVGYSFE
ncbi:MAG: porin family protein [Verrucomicrobia bacterium]|nr:porin family protein [Verrucomicrobiota bacterium]